MSTFLHLPFEAGLASIVSLCAPQGRYGTQQARHSITTPICRVTMFRDGQPAEHASFFGTQGVWQWIEQELGCFQPKRLRTQLGQTNAQALSLLWGRLTAARLVPCEEGARASR